MAELRIGTSGWQYKHWQTLFYPAGLSSKRWLEYYARYFSSTEVNYSFYRLPSAATYSKWMSQVSDDFLFTLKCSRLITHAKRLGSLKDLWTNFLSNADSLQDALGPILCQLPETFTKDTARLDQFLTTAKHSAGAKRRLRLALEFRHQSWFTTEIYRLLEKHGAALVCADSSLFPRVDRLTTDFTYFRYHGPHSLFASKYTKKQLEAQATKMEEYLRQNIDVFAYFNNDGHGYAVDNALQLKTLLQDETKASA